MALFLETDMRHTAALALLLLAACGKKNESSSSSSSSGTPAWKASTPEELFESMKAAEQRKDPKSVWDNAYSKKLKEQVVKSMESMIDLCKKDKEFAKKTKEEIGGDKDPATMTAEEFYLAQSKNEMANDPSEGTLIESKVDGDKATIRFKSKKTRTGKEREKTARLVKEDGLWRIDG